MSYVVVHGIAGAGDANGPQGSMAAWEGDLDPQGQSTFLTAMNPST
jgi:hypothetical protein